MVISFQEKLPQIFFIVGPRRGARMCRIAGVDKLVFLSQQQYKLAAVSTNKLHQKQKRTIWGAETSQLLVKLMKVFSDRSTVGAV